MAASVVVPPPELACPELDAPPDDPPETAGDELAGAEEAGAEDAEPEELAGADEDPPPDATVELALEDDELAAELDEVDEDELEPPLLLDPHAETIRATAARPAIAPFRRSAARV